MAITYSYPTATPELQDLLVGTEMAEQGGEGNPRTRTFTIGSIINLTPVPSLDQVTSVGGVTTNTITINKEPDYQALVITGDNNYNGLIQVSTTDGVGIKVSNNDGNAILVSNYNGNAVSTTTSGGYAIVASATNSDGTAGYFSSPGEAIKVVNGGVNISGIVNTVTGYQLALSANSAAKPVSNTWTVTSDNRVKTNVNPYIKGLETILAINPVTYDYNGKAGFDPTTTGNIGIIAQDVLSIIPESINTYFAKLNEEDKEKTELYNFDSHALTFILINAVKQLNAEIELLKSK